MIFLSIFSWLALSIIVGVIGSSRKIGFAAAFLLSLLLSPLIGLIIAVVSKSKIDIEYQEQLLEAQKQQKETLDKISNQNSVSNVTDELKKVKELLDNGTINQEEFDKMKSKIIDSLDNLKTFSKSDKDSNDTTSTSIDYNTLKIKTQNRIVNNSIFGDSEIFEIEFEEGIKGIIYHILSQRDFYFKQNGLFHYYDNYDNCISALHRFMTKQELSKIGFVCTYKKTFWRHEILSEN